MNSKYLRKYCLSILLYPTHPHSLSVPCKYLYEFQKKKTPVLLLASDSFRDGRSSSHTQALMEKGSALFEEQVSKFQTRLLQKHCLLELTLEACTSEHNLSLDTLHVKHPSCCMNTKRFHQNILIICPALIPPIVSKRQTLVYLYSPVSSPVYMQFCVAYIWYKTPPLRGLH